jgi:hypothetical protein
MFEAGAAVREALFGNASDATQKSTGSAGALQRTAMSNMAPLLRSPPQATP